MHDVIVIGGGIAGTATAYFLAADGVSTLLIERDELNTQASGSNSGSLHAQIPFEPFMLGGSAWAEKFAPVVPLLKESISFWQRIPELLGVDLEVAIKGGVMAASSDADMRLLERKVFLERRCGLDVELLGRSELRAYAPYLSDSLIGAALCRTEGSANPLRAAPAFAAGAQRLGATVLMKTRVTGLSSHGGTYTVHTTRGDHKASRVVNAAGADAGKIAAMVGMSLEVAGEPIQASVTERVEPLIPHLVYFTGEKLTLKQTHQGTIIIGGGWPAVLDSQKRPVVNLDSLSKNLAVALEVVPSLARINVVRSWAAVVNGTDDWRPLLGESPYAKGFFVVFFPWLGFTAGPLVGRITASLVQGKPPPVESQLAPFLLS